jgi:hypothetical protein
MGRRGIGASLAAGRAPGAGTGDTGAVRTGAPPRGCWGRAIDPIGAWACGFGCPRRGAQRGRGHDGIPGRSLRGNRAASAGGLPAGAGEVCTVAAGPGTVLDGGRRTFKSLPSRRVEPGTNGIGNQPRGRRIRPPNHPCGTNRASSATGTRMQRRPWWLRGRAVVEPRITPQRPTQSSWAALGRGRSPCPADGSGPWERNQLPRPHSAANHPREKAVRARGPG